MSMTNNKVFNSDTELLLRAILVLSKFSNLNIDQIAEIDFKVTYGRHFGLSDENLHGNNEFDLQEYSLRRKKLNDAIVKGVLQGSVLYKEQHKKGFVYCLSSKGEMVVLDFNSKDLYFKEYLDNLNRIQVPAENEAVHFSDNLSNKLWVKYFEN